MCRFPRPTTFVFAIGCLLVVGVCWVTLSKYPDPKISLRATLGGMLVTLEVADTEALREKGLSGHRPLDAQEGMFFVFLEEGSYGFWMKDMLFPIDIIWLDAEKRIVDAKEGADPRSYPEIFVPRTPARYAVELPSGFFEKHHLKMGNTLEILK